MIHQIKWQYCKSMCLLVLPTAVCCHAKCLLLSFFSFECLLFPVNVCYFGEWSVETHQMLLRSWQMCANVNEPCKLVLCQRIKRSPQIATAMVVLSRSSQSNKSPAFHSSSQINRPWYYMCVAWHRSLLSQVFLTYYFLCVCCLYCSSFLNCSSFLISFLPSVTVVNTVKPLK